MRKITVFCLLLLSIFSLNAQQMNWSPEVNTNNRREEVEYIGSANQKNYFISKAAKHGLFSIKIEVYFFSTNSNNEFVKEGDRIILENSDIIKAFVKDNNINILLKTIDNGEAIVELVVFDSETLNEKENEAKDLLKFDIGKRDEVVVYFKESADKTKYCLNYLSTDYRTSKGYLQFNVFENDNTPLWSNRFDNDFEGMLRIYDFHLENSGDVYMYAVNSIPINKKEKEYKLLILKANEYDTRDSEFNISLNWGISSMSFYKIDSNIIFLATQSQDLLSTYKLDLEQEDILSQNSFRLMNVEDNYIDWSLSSFHKLDNGNLVLPMENKYAIKYISNNSTSYVFYNYNMIFALIDPDNNELIKKQHISKYISFTTTKYMEHGYFEAPYFCSNGDEFFALYNNNVKYKDLEENSVRWLSPTSSKGSKKFQTQLLRIDQSGNIKLETLFSMKKDKRMFSAYTTFFNSDNELIISGGNAKGYSFTKYKL